MDSSLTNLLRGGGGEAFQEGMLREAAKVISPARTRGGTCLTLANDFAALNTAAQNAAIIRQVASNLLTSKQGKESSTHSGGPQTMTLASLKGSKQGGTRPKHMKLEGRSGKDFLAHELEEGVKLLLSVGNAGCALWEIVGVDGTKVRRVAVVDDVQKIAVLKALDYYKTDEKEDMTKCFFNAAELAAGEEGGGAAEGTQGHGGKEGL